jgi:hypothetical protein
MSSNKPPADLTDEEILEYLKARGEHPLIQADLDALEPGVPQAVRLQLAPIRCWKCRQGIKAVRGYVFGDTAVPDEQVFIALQKVTDTRQLVALVADLRKHDPAITPVGFNYSKTMGGQYFSARCPHCSFLCGNFFMTNSTFFPEHCICDYPDCQCSDSPNEHCHRCEYHEAKLRLSVEEIEEIKEWIGVPT